MIKIERFVVHVYPQFQNHYTAESACMEEVNEWVAGKNINVINMQCQWGNGAERRSNWVEILLFYKEV